jgi:tRNA(fMet)-specific endonuclease VapC
MTDARFMLDTDTVSYILRGERSVAARLTACAPSELCVSALTVAELRFGAEKRRAQRLHRLIDVFTATIAVMPFDGGAAATFGRICAKVRSRGTPIGAIDTLIAAHASALGLRLVTNNTKH